MALEISMEEVEKRLLWLDALEEAGVDNWDGFDEARKIYKELLSFYDKGDTQ